MITLGDCNLIDLFLEVSRGKSLITISIVSNTLRSVANFTMSVADDICIAAIR